MASKEAPRRAILPVKGVRPLGPYKLMVHAERDKFNSSYALMWGAYRNAEPHLLPEGHKLRSNRNSAMIETAAGVRQPHDRLVFTAHRLLMSAFQAGYRYRRDKLVIEQVSPMHSPWHNASGLLLEKMTQGLRFDDRSSTADVEAAADKGPHSIVFSYVETEQMAVAALHALLVVTDGFPNLKSMHDR